MGIRGKSEPEYGLSDSPGPLLRRAHQIGVGIFLEECASFRITPLQFSALWALSKVDGGIPQIQLAGMIALDRTTIAIVLAKLEKEGFVARSRNPRNTRANVVTLTEAGGRHLETMMSKVMAVQEKIIEPLTEEERELFLRALRKIAESNNQLSRAPMTLLPIG